MDHPLRTIARAPGRRHCSVRPNVSGSSWSGAVGPTITSTTTPGPRSRPAAPSRLCRRYVSLFGLSSGARSTAPAVRSRTRLAVSKYTEESSCRRIGPLVLSTDPGEYIEAERAAVEVVRPPSVKPHTAFLHQGQVAVASSRNLVRVVRVVALAKPVGHHQSAAKA